MSSCHGAGGNPRVAGVKVRDLPENERPRERLMFSGVDALTSEDLLAVLLGTGRRGQPVLSLARDLMLKLGGLRALAEMDVRELCALDGLGPSFACRIVAAVALGRRSLSEPLAERRRLATPRQVYHHVARRTRGKKKEVFIAIYVDGKNRCLREEVVSEGTLDSSLVHPREVFRPAIKTAASGVIVAHNHPSGDPTPSPEDFEVSQRLVSCGRLLGIRLIDHVVVGARRYVSFRERGLLEDLAATADRWFDRHAGGGEP